MRQKPNQILDGVPGTRGFPLVGDVPRMLPDPLPFVQTLHRRYGNVFYAHFAFNERSVFLLGPAATELALISEADRFSNQLGYQQLAAFLGERTILFQDGPAHKALRQSLNPAFKPENLRRYMATAVGEIDRQLSMWSGGTQRILRDIHLMTLRVASRSIIGADVDEEAAAINKHFLNMLAGMVTLVPNIPCSPRRRGFKARAYIDRFFRSRVGARKASPGSDVFSQLCSPDAALTDDEIVDNLVGILFASYETTASSIANMLHALAINPDWQGRLRDELAPLRRADEDAYDAVRRCHQTDWFLKETLRLYPPISFLPRWTLQEVVIEGITIPPRTPVTLAPRFSHHLSSIYTAPDMFDPDRFSPSRAEDQTHRCAWLPFGKGAHACIGMHFARMEVFTFFAHLLGRYRVESTRGTLSLSHVPVLRPRGKLPVNLVAL
jgi:cytochrome P450